MQKDVFELAKERDKRNKADGVEKVPHISTKVLLEEQHSNRLLHEQNRKKVMGEDY
jgi:hypothetical protein